MAVGESETCQAVQETLVRVVVTKPNMNASLRENGQDQEQPASTVSEDGCALTFIE